MLPELKHWLKLKYIMHGSKIRVKAKGSPSSNYWNSCSHEKRHLMLSELLKLQKRSLISDVIYTTEYDNDDNQICYRVLSDKLIDEIFKE